MNNREMVLAEFQNKPENTLIMTGQLYREKYANMMSEAAFAQIISRLCRSGEIERVSKGIYCRPKKTRFGTIFPSEREIVDLFKCTWSYNTDSQASDGVFLYCGGTVKTNRQCYHS